MRAIQDNGKRYGRLTVLNRDGRYINCLCDCGTEKSIRSSHVRGGLIVSCGCFISEATAARNTTHGLRRSAEYHSWAGMIQRCRNPKNKLWSYYGGRGISVCDEWAKDFPRFLADVGPRPGPKYGIDRIDNNSHYEPGNVRWATHKVQANNKRNNRLETVGDVTLTLAEWADRLNVPYKKLWAMLKNGTATLEGLAGGAE